MTEAQLSWIDTVRYPDDDFDDEAEAEAEAECKAKDLIYKLLHLTHPLEVDFYFEEQASEYELEEIDSRDAKFYGIDETDGKHRQYRDWCVGNDVHSWKYRSRARKQWARHPRRLEDHGHFRLVDAMEENPWRFEETEVLSPDNWQTPHAENKVEETFEYHRNDLRWMREDAEYNARVIRMLAEEVSNDIDPYGDDCDGEVDDLDSFADDYDDEVYGE